MTAHKEWSAEYNGMPDLVNDPVSVAEIGKDKVRASFFHALRDVSLAGPLNVRLFGTRGDGVSDDTVAINAALDTARSTNKALYLPAGTYLVTPNNTGTIGAYALDLRGVEMFGDGMGRTVIKVAAGSQPYFAVCTSGPTHASDASGMHVHDLTFDHNIANNELPSVGHDPIDYANLSVDARVGSNLKVSRVEVKNSSPTNAFYLGGTLIGNVSVRDCVMIEGMCDDPNHVQHDVSLIYAHAIAGQTIVSGNQFGADLSSAANRTAIETHGPQQIVSANQVDGFYCPINATGVDTAADFGIQVINNTLRNCLVGIELYSMPYSTHTTGFGIDGALVQGNTIDLIGFAGATSPWWDHTITYEAGIIVHPSATGELDVRGLVIDNNIIRHPLEATAIDNHTSSMAIGWSSFNGKTLYDSRITNNTVIGFPMNGCRLQCGVRGVKVDNNTFVNCGTTLDSGTPLFYRYPIMVNTLVAHTVGIDDLSIERNKIVDDIATCRYTYAMYLGNGTAVCHNFKVRHNTFRHGTLPGGFRHIYTASATATPYVEETITGFASVKGTGIGTWRPGSRVIDPNTGLAYTLNAAGTGFTESRPFHQAMQTFTADDVTPSVLDGHAYKTANVNPTTITAFDDGVSGQIIFVLINDANTTIDFSGTTLKGNGGVDWHPNSGDFLVATFEGTNWYCQVYQPNAAINMSWSTFIADDGSPSVAGHLCFKTANVNPTTITALDDGVPGQRVTVLINDSNTTVDFTGTTLKGNGGADWSPGAGDFMVCVFEGTNWYCQITET